MKVFVFVLMVCCISRVLSAGAKVLGDTGCKAASDSAAQESDKCDDTKKLKCDVAQDPKTCACADNFYNKDGDKTNGCEAAQIGNGLSCANDPNGCKPGDYCKPGVLPAKTCENLELADADCKLTADCTPNAECDSKTKKCVCEATSYKDTGKKCPKKIQTNNGPCTGTTEGECLNTDYCAPAATSGGVKKCKTKLAGGAECKAKTECKSGICEKAKPADPKGKCSGATVLNASVLTFMIAIMSTFFKSG